MTSKNPPVVSQTTKVTEGPFDFRMNTLVAAKKSRVIYLKEEYKRPNITLLLTKTTGDMFASRYAQKSTISTINIDEPQKISKNYEIKTSVIKSSDDLPELID